VSEIEDENLLDVDTAEVHPETPNTFGRNLLRRLGIAYDQMEAEAASISPTSDYTGMKIMQGVTVGNKRYIISCYIATYIIQC